MPGCVLMAPGIVWQQSSTVALGISTIPKGGVLPVCKGYSHSQRQSLWHSHHNNGDSKDEEV